jgi:hydroxymethylpyrimidine/phosphomethylpyrimidine kinase
MQRPDTPVTRPVVLSIAGSDSGGGAGIQADVKTIEAGGGFGTTAITSVTAQNTTGVHGTHLLPIEEIEGQVHAVRSDFDVSAVKTGMLATSDVIDLVTEQAPDLPNLVVDPVMVAASGDRLLAEAAEESYEDLIAHSTLVTPNADEAEVLTGREITDIDAAIAAGRELVEMGADAALVKGGHVPGDDVVDVLVTADSVTTIRHDRIDTEATHGSGCTLSSAIATRLAHGDDLTTAVESGINLLSRAVRYNLDVGEGPGAVHHMVQLRNDAAGTETRETVESIVDRLPTDSPFSGEPVTVAGATPYAEAPSEIVGSEPGQPAQFGAAESLARVLLAVREYDGNRRFAAACPLPSDTDGTCATLSGPVVVVDPEPSDKATEKALSTAIEAAEESPVGIIDHTDNRLVLLGNDPETLLDRIDAVRERVSE